jgi:hypothetical protein
MISLEWGSELRGMHHMTGGPPSLSTDHLRIGVVLDSPVVPSWVAQVIRDIHAAEFLRLAVVVFSRPRQKRYWHGGNPRAWRTALFHLYEALDHRMFRVGRDALAPVDISPDLLCAEMFHQQLAGTGAPSSLAEADRARLRAMKLDVILDFSGQAGKDALTKWARYGVWSVHIGDQGRGRGNPPLFWEIYRQRPIARTEVRVQTEQTNTERVVYRSFSRLNSLSLNLSRNGICWKSAAVLMRRLQDLSCHGWDYLVSLDAGEEVDSSPQSGAGPPGNLTMARFVVRSLADLARRFMRRSFYRHQWILALRPRPIGSVSASETAGFRLIVPSRERFYADPFILKKGGVNYVFCEEFLYDRPKGVISCFEVDARGNYSEPRVVLEREYHLSYPFVFEWQGQIYLLPETGANRTIELYRAVEFPHRWELAHVLMENLHALDPTLLKHRGKFWLFVNPRVEGHPDCEELDVFFANSPLGPWTPHPKNPVVSDVRRARPAGRLFWANGQLFRPAQDCSVRYGYAVSLNRVDVLSESDYREVPVRRIDPDWLPGNLATHTFNFSEDLEVIDAQLEVSKYWAGRKRAIRC